VTWRYFALERIALVAGEQVPLVAEESPQIATCLHGAAAVTADELTVPLVAGQTAAVLADAQDMSVRAERPTVLLRGWVPDSTTV
jgi:mannose-6-phosphate isomerase class I